MEYFPMGINDKVEQKNSLWGVPSLNMHMSITEGKI